MVKKVRKNNTTVDQLTVMVQRGFIGVDKRFDEVDKRFEEIDNRFTAIEKKLDHIEQIILEQHRERIGHLEDRVTALEADFRSLISGKRQ